MLKMENMRDFSKVGDGAPVPNLIEIQRASYERFLQDRVSRDERKDEGLEALLREVFPIVSYDESVRLEYLDYEFGDPRYTKQECLDLRLSYGRPFRIRCRLIRKDTKDVLDESIYLGEMPIMLGGGEFVINGAERVIVSQLHRSPGVDFSVEMQESDRPLHGARIIPERGSWIELSVSKKDTLTVRVDQSSKIPATTFLRAMDESLSTTAAIIREFYETKTVPVDQLKPTMYLVEEFVDPDDGEVVVPAGGQVGEARTRIAIASPANWALIGRQWLEEGLELKPLEVSREELGVDESRAGDKEYDRLLSILEERLILEYPDDEGLSEIAGPRFNREPKKRDKAMASYEAEQEHLEATLNRLKKELDSRKGWLAVTKETRGQVKGDWRDKAGIYAYRDAETKKVEHGYIGQGKLTSKDWSIGARVYRHYQETQDNLPKNIGDTLRKNREDGFPKHITKWLARKSGSPDTGETLTRNASTPVKELEVIEKVEDPLVLNTLAEDQATDHENALLRMYIRLRPGNPPQIEKAKTLFAEKFYDENRYRLGKVGRFRLNRKFHSGDTLSVGGMAFDRICALQPSPVKDPGPRYARAEEGAKRNKFGSGPFCRFEIPKQNGERAGVYAFVVDGRLAYLGECEDLANRFNAGYGNISPKNCFEGGRPTNCMVNSLVRRAADAGASVDLYFAETADYKNAEKKLIQRFDPPWNLKDSPSNRHEPESYQKGLAVGAVPEDEMTLRPGDFLHTLKYVMRLRAGEGTVDDIDHLGNRRLRTIDELGMEEMRKGFLKLRRTVQERMSLKDMSELTKIAELVNSKSISSSIDYFFGRGELSQVVDQQNPLAQLTHERRLSALGPGGLNRKRAGFEVRDVHISHYGRICPIETPEGNNIGLISSLSIYAGVDEYGFLTTPYRKVEKSKVTDKIVYLRADEEMETVLAPPDVVEKEDKGGFGIPEEHVLARVGGELSMVGGDDVDCLDISPKQTVGISAALIPFLEHDDANRALMGSNMQRQAVPLVNTEPPLVATGMERSVAQNSGMVVRARKAGTVTFVDGGRIVIDDSDEYELDKFQKLNERACLNQKPVVVEGQRVKKGEILADGPGCCKGELALGRNVLCAFMPFDGYNFEDAILISERMVKTDAFTSVHMEEYEVEVRETKLGREEFTRDIPNVSERALANLDENGIVRIGTRVEPGDILCGKVSPKSKSELTPEEKLLHAIFGRAGEDVKNDSLELPAGEEGVVVQTKRFSRRSHMTDQQKKQLKREMDEHTQRMDSRICDVFRQMCEEINEVLGTAMVDPSTRQKVGQSDIPEVLLEQIDNFNPKWIKAKSDAAKKQAEGLREKYWPRIDELKAERDRKLDHMKRGDELPSGVLEMVKVTVATKRTLGVGDKMAGRHGNKGVIGRILPEEDMPFLPDGTPIDIVLNPLGVPGRMNLGQILETHLGWAAAVLGFKAITPVFDGAKEAEISQCVREANEYVRTRCEDLGALQEAGETRELLVEMPEDGKIMLYDGRTGEPLEQKVTVGYIYMNKLHHLVDEKIHARATGPYSLITQQPLGGKARTGGQRFGEMEVWGLEAYGASYTLQELLTVKSDDVEGRTKIYESMVKGTNTLEAGTPVSFDVLCNELRGLGLNIQLEKKRLI